MPSVALLALTGARRGALEAVARGHGALIDTVAETGALRRLLERRAVDLVLGEGLDAETLVALTAAHPASKFVVLAPESEALDLILAGAAAVLPRDADADAIAAALRLIGSGLRLLPESALGQLLAPGGGEGEPDAPALTPREREVLAAMADGASNKVIARRLGISFHTAKFHVASILAKLDADTRTEALVRAARLGLVML